MKQHNHVIKSSWAILGVCTGHLVQFELYSDEFDSGKDSMPLK